MSHSDAVSRKAQRLSGTPTRPFTLYCLSRSPLHSFSLSNSVCFDLLQKSTVHHFHDTHWSSNHRGKACRQQNSMKPAASQWMTGNIRDTTEKNKQTINQFTLRSCREHVAIMQALLYIKFHTELVN